MTYSIATRPDDQSNRSVGERAWDVLREHRIPPTPCSFTVFYTLLNGGNPRLEQHFRRLEASGGRVTHRDIEALHGAYIDGRDDAAEVAAGANDLAEVAQGIVEQVSRGSDALRAYGGALDHWRDRLDVGTDAVALARAVEAPQDPLSRPRDSQASGRKGRDRGSEPRHAAGLSAPAGLSPAAPAADHF